MRRLVAGSALALAAAVGALAPPVAAATPPGPGTGDLATSWGAPELPGPRPTSRVAALAATWTGRGVWLVGEDGWVWGQGDARPFPHRGGNLAGEVVAMVPTPSGQGYWLASEGGGVAAFGDAALWPAVPSPVPTLPVVRPTVALAATPSGRGYWLLDVDGRISAFGDAAPHVAPAAPAPVAPAVALARTVTGGGLWIVREDGSTVAMGDAPPLGPTGWDRAAAGPVVAAFVTPSGRGAWLAGSDGRVVASGDAAPFGRPAFTCWAEPVVDFAARPGGGYWMARAQPPRPGPAATAGRAPLDQVTAESDQVTALLRATQVCQVPVAPRRGLFGPAVASTRLGPGFGPRTHPIYGVPQLHLGADLAAAAGVPVRSPAPGRVASVGTRAGYGLTVVVDHGGRLATLHAHLSRASVGVGQVVGAGTVLGAVGSTGFATGPHLHLELRVDGVPVDPLPFIPVR